MGVGGDRSWDLSMGSLWGNGVRLRKGVGRKL